MNTMAICMRTSQIHIKIIRFNKLFLHNFQTISSDSSRSFKAVATFCYIRLFPTSGRPPPNQRDDGQAHSRMNLAPKAPSHSSELAQL